MGKLKEIFSGKPEEISFSLKWVFTLPLSYITYLAVSLFFPESGSFHVNQIIRSALLAVCILCYVKYFLNMDIPSFLSEGRFFRFSLFAKGFLVMFAASAITGIVYILLPCTNVVRCEHDSFLSNWLISLCTVVVSAFTEEVMYRCFFVRFGRKTIIGVSNRSRLICACIAALFFSIAHFPNPELKENMLIPLLYYYVFGFALTLFFFKTAGFEYGFGVHIANNVFASWILNYRNSVMPTKSLFIDNTGSMLISAVMSFVCIVISSLFLFKGRENEEKK